MIKLSKKADYGLVFLTALARDPEGGYVSLKTLAKNNNLPYKFLSQIAVELNNADLVESKEGVGGGYRLAHSPEEINVAHAIEALEGPIAPTTCLRGKKCQNESRCGHKQVMESLSQTITQSLKNFSIKDLVRNVTHA